MKPASSKEQLCESELTTLDFHGNELVAIKGDSPATMLVDVKRISDGMGLIWEGQRKELLAHPVLGPCTTVTVVQLPGDTQVREHTFLPLNRINFWLALVQSTRVRDPTARQAIVVFQTKCADMLYDAWFPTHARAIDDLGPNARAAVGGIAKSVVDKAVARRWR